MTLHLVAQLLAAQTILDRPAIRFGSSARLSASCTDDQSTEFAVMSPRVMRGPISGSVNLTLRHTSHTCYDVPLTQPCASTGFPDYPPLFVCSWGGALGGMKTAAVGAEAAPVVIDGVFTGAWHVHVPCAMPTFDQFVNLTGYAHDGADQTLTVSLQHVGATSPTPIKYVGMPSGDVLHLRELVAHPPPTPAMPSPMPPPPPGFSGSKIMAVGQTYGGTDSLSSAQKFLPAGWSMSDMFLVYQMSRDGTSKTSWRDKMKAAPSNGGAFGLPTWTVIKTTFNFAFGGYTMCNWYNAGERQYCTDSTAYTFSFNADFKSPIKSGGSNAIYQIQTNYAGPTWGGGFDMSVTEGTAHSSLDGTAGSYCNFGHSYTCPPGTSGTSCRNAMCGDHSWVASEIEVYVKQRPS